MNGNPLLSICIPTYNRAEYLEASLKSIVEAEGFSEKIEVVVSDNCSDDNTEETVKKYAEKYENIKYFRNEKNVNDQNFPLAFQRATGVFRKLSNDTVIYKSDALKYMLELVEKHISDKPVIYFMNDERSSKEESYDDLDNFIKRLGVNITWIRSLSMWDEDSELLQIMQTHVDSKLSQIPFLLELFLKHHSAIVVNRELMRVQNVSKKNVSYGLYKIFYKNYLGFMETYVRAGKLLETTYEYLKKDLLFNFFLHWIVNFELNRKQYLTADEDLRTLVENEYKEEIYFSEYKRQFKKIYRSRRWKERVKKILYPIFKVVKNR